MFPRAAERSGPDRTRRSCVPMDRRTAVGFALLWVCQPGPSDEASDSGAETASGSEDETSTSEEFGDDDDVLDANPDVGADEI